MNTNLKWAIVGGLFLIPFVPFIISGSILFPFITGKNFLFRVIVEIVFALWIILIMRDKEYRPKFSWLLGSLAIFTVVMGISTLFAENPFKAFWSNFERMEGFIALIHFFLYFLVASSVLHTLKQWAQYFYAWIGSSVIMCLYGLLQLSGKITINQGGVRVDGTLGNANYLAVFLMFNIFFGIFLFLRSQNKKTVAWVLAPAVFLQLVILYFTATRGSILGLIGGLFVTVVLTALFERERVGLRNVAIGGVVALLIFVGGFVALKNTSFVTESPVLSRFSSLSLSEIKNQGRFYIWPMALEGAKERPILGWGQEGFSYVFNEHYNPKMYAQEQWFDRAHNMFLDWLVAGGILGLLSFLSVLFFAFWYVWKDPNNSLSFAEKSVLSGLLSAYVFQGLFVFDNLIGYIMFFSVLALIHSVRGGDHIAMPRALESKGAAQTVSAIAVVLLIGALYFGTWVPLQAGQTLIDALRAAQSSDAPKALELFKKALSKRTVGTPEIREQLISASGVFLNAGVPEGIRGQYADLVRAEYEKQFSEAPNDARYYLFYGIFLRNVGLGDLAIENFLKAESLSPQKQTIAIEIGLTYLQGKQYEKALEYFKKASDADPSYVQAKMFYAVSALYTNNTALANSIFESIPNETLINDEKVVQALAQTGRYPELVKIFTQRIAEGAETYENYMSLAVSYLESGDRASAVRVLKIVLTNNAVEKDEERKAQINYYITEIEAGRNP